MCFENNAQFVCERLNVERCDTVRKTREGSTHSDTHTYKHIHRTGKHEKQRRRTHRNANKFSDKFKMHNKHMHSNDFVHEKRNIIEINIAGDVMYLLYIEIDTFNPRAQIKIRIYSFRQIDLVVGYLLFIFNSIEKFSFESKLLILL